MGSRHRGRGSNHSNTKTYPSKDYLKKVSKNVLWILINSFLYLAIAFLLKELFNNGAITQDRIIYLLLMGLFFSIFVRIIYCLLNKDRIYIDFGVFSTWALAYAFTIWLSEFVYNTLIKYQVLPAIENIYLHSIFIGILIHILILVYKKIDIDFGSMKRKTPSNQVHLGILLIVLGLLELRFSTTIFMIWLKWGEGLAWSWLIGVGLIIGGFLVLLAWWRNNVASFNFHGHWWNH